MSNFGLLKQLIPSSMIGAIAVLGSAATKPADAAVMYESTPFETLTVDSTKNIGPIGQPSVFSSVLESGVRYKFEVSGQWDPDFRDPQQPEYIKNWYVDARFTTRDNWSSYTDVDPDYGDFGLYSNVLGSGNDDFWGSYQSNHVYSHEYLGKGQAVDFYIYDINSGDNAGGYTVKIFREAKSVPEPSVMMGLLAIGALGAGSRLKRFQKQKQQTASFN